MKIDKLRNDEYTQNPLKYTHYVGNNIEKRNKLMGEKPKENINTNYKANELCCHLIMFRIKIKNINIVIAWNYYSSNNQCI